VLLLAVGRMVEIAQKVASNLAARNISCGVVNARWVKPLDPRLDEWVSSYRRVVTLEDNVISGGFGSAVLEHLSGTELSSKVSVMGIPDRFLAAGTVDDLLQELGLDVDSLAGRVALLLGE